MNRIRILIVDDSLTIRAIMEQVFAKDPRLLVIGVASNAEEAHEMIEWRHPHVVTLDIAMPGMDGLEFLSAVMREKPLPIVMVSSATASGSGVIDEALRRGAIACFDKAHVMSDAVGLLRVIKEAARHKPKPITGPAAAPQAASATVVA